MERQQSTKMMVKEKLDFFGILKESLKIPSKNISFTFFSLFVSLPLFFFMIFYEIFLQTTLFETSKILIESAQPIRYNFPWMLSYYFAYYNSDSSAALNFSVQLIRMSFLHLVPLFLLEFFVVILLIVMVSNIYTSEKPLILRDMIHKSMNETWLKSSFVTSVYVLFLSSCIILGMIWLVMNCFIISVGFLFDLLLWVSHGMAFLVLLRKYLDWSAFWNMCIVISVLEESSGAAGMVVLAYFRRGSERRGMLLMLVFFVWGLVLRLIGLFVRSKEGENQVIIVSVLVGLMCLGNVMKWVVCVVYFFDCKRRVLEKKVDADVGRDDEEVGKEEAIGV